MRDTADSIAIRLGAKKTKSGWIATCPAHDDENPSLSIAEGKDGRTLLKCHAGCSFEQISNALGLGTSDQGKSHKKSKKLKSRREYRYECADGKSMALKVREDFHDGSKRIFWKVKPAGLLRPYLYSQWNSKPRVFFVEGEKCAEIIGTFGGTATTVGGATSWHADAAQFFEGREVILVPDNDNAGRSHIEDVFKDLESVAKSLTIVELPGLRESEDVYDWLSQGHSLAELDALIQKAPPPREVIREWNNKKVAIFTRLDSVQPREVEFLWPPYIPRAKVTGLAGDPGIGKTNIVASVVSDLSKGRPLPGCETAILGETVIFTAEDDIDDTIVPRLNRLDADLTRIHAYPAPVQLNSESFKEIRAAICAVRPKLVVFDPIQSYIGNIDMHRANEVRLVLVELIKLAQELRCSVIIVMHMNKTNMKGTYRALGSIDFIAAIRSLLIAGRSSKDKSKYAMLHAKSNCGPLGQNLGYELKQGKFAWTGATNLTEADILSAELEPNAQRKGIDAIDFLYDQLKAGPMDSKELLNVAIAAGFSTRTIKRAKEELGVDSFKSGSKWMMKLRKEMHY